MQDNIICDDFVMEGSEIWFPSKENNTFYLANLKTKATKCLWRFPDEKPFVIRLFHGIIKYKYKIFMFPCEADNIAVYNINTHTITRIELEPRQIQRQYWHNPSKTLFWKAVQSGGYIYAGGMAYKGIIKLDPETLETKCIDDWSDKVESDIGADNNEVYVEDCLVDGKYIYFPLCCMDAILRLDLRTDTTDLLRLNSGLSGFAGIEKWNSFFVLLPRKAEEVIIYHPNNNYIEKIKIPYEKEKNSMKRVPFERHFIFNDRLYVFRAFCNKNYIIDLRNRTVVENVEDPFRNKKVGSLYFTDNIRCIFIEADTKKWVIYNLKSKKYEQEIQFKMEAAEKKECICKQMDDNKEKIWQENDELRLREYLLYIT